MSRQYAKVKEWVVNKAQDIASGYNVFIDVESRDEKTGATKADENGYLTVVVEEVLNETEKAVQVILASGSVVGSCKGWKTWIPKSQIQFAE